MSIIQELHGCPFQGGARLEGSSVVLPCLKLLYSKTVCLPPVCLSLASSSLPLPCGHLRLSPLFPHLCDLVQFLGLCLHCFVK